MSPLGRPRWLPPLAHRISEWKNVNRRTLRNCASDSSADGRRGRRLRRVGASHDEDEAALLEKPLTRIVRPQRRNGSDLPPVQTRLQRLSDTVISPATGQAHAWLDRCNLEYLARPSEESQAVEADVRNRIPGQRRRLDHAHACIGRQEQPRGRP